MEFLFASFFRSEQLFSWHVLFISFQLCVEILRPSSRGFVKLRSRDPLTHPVIQPNYLTRDSDRRLMRTCVRIARHVLSQKAFEPYRGKELRPGLWWKTCNGLFCKDMLGFIIYCFSIMFFLFLQPFLQCIFSSQAKELRRDRGTIIFRERSWALNRLGNAVFSAMWSFHLLLLMYLVLLYDLFSLEALCFHRCNIFHWSLLL